MARVCKPIEFDVDENGCFICTSHAKDQDGYPLLKRKGKMIRMSRYIYEECFGLIPKGLFIRHKCDNPSCINPEHLLQGTPKQNSLDMVMRDRQAKGEQNGFSKLNSQLVLAMRRAKKYHTYDELSEIFGVSKFHCMKIVCRKLWTHI